MYEFISELFVCDLHKDYLYVTIIYVDTYVEHLSIHYSQPITRQYL